MKVYHMEVYVLIHYTYDYHEFESFKGLYRTKGLAIKAAKFEDDSIMIYNSHKEMVDDETREGDYDWWLIELTKVNE